MYLSLLQIKNFRCFDGNEHSITFKKGLNVLVGENDSGKSAIMDAIKLILGTTDMNWYRVEQEDFYKEDATLEIKITCKFEELNEDERGAFLECLSYEDENKKIPCLYLHWTCRYLSSFNPPRPVVNVSTGIEGNGSSPSAEARELLRATYLRALRDAYSEMQAGRHSRLSQIMQHISVVDQGVDEYEEGIDIHNLSIAGIADLSNTLLAKHPALDSINEEMTTILQEKMLLKKDNIRTRLEVTGSNSNKIKKEMALLEKLDLAVDKDASDMCGRVGLGTSNIMSMACELLLHNEAIGDNKSCFLLIEEPEAHIHAQRQLKLIQSLEEESEKGNRQTIITTHSPLLASVVKLSNIVIVKSGKVYSLEKEQTKLDEDDYLYLEKYLDATKANLFFARSVIIVEGPGEALLLPTLSKLLGCNFTDYGTSLVDVRSTGLRRYARIFQRKDENKQLDVNVAYIAEACEALQIIDETRCFIFLFSKIDGMGLCDTYSFTDNKKRILSIVAENQSNFDVISSQLYFYSKEIRTEVVHKGKRIDELVSIRKAHEINQELFNIIIRFCTKVIDSEITSIESLKEYILNEVSKYSYKMPQEQSLAGLPVVYSQRTTYVATLEGLQISYPEKRGNYLLLPSLNQFEYDRYYKNYVSKDLGEDYESIFNDFSIEDFEYIIEILYRCERADDGYPRVIGLNLPKISDEYMRSQIIREQFVDYICNELNECLYYDMLSGGDILNGEVLPPRVGLRTGIRAIYEFVEDKEELFLQFVPGRVFSEYQIPSEAYNCIKLYKDDIYEILFGNANYIDNLCKRSLVNICESEYVRDWTQRISYLFDTFDGIDPRNYNKEKVIKLVFTILAIDKADYLRNKQKYEQLKNKYRNPILHGGKSIFEIEPDINEIKKVDTYLRKTIMDYCLKIHSLSISTWEELDNAYRVQQNFLKL